MTTFDIISNKFSKLPAQITKNVQVAIKTSISDIRQISSTEHRYITRSGNADKAYVEKYPTPLIGILGLDIRGRKSNAPYVKWLHVGHGTWKPDRFLFRAFDKYKPKTIKNIDKAIEKSIKDVF